MKRLLKVLLICFSLSIICFAEITYELLKKAEKIKDPKNVILIYSKIIEKNPNHIQALLKRGAARMAIGDYIGAMQDINKSISLDKSLKASKLSKEFNYWIPSHIHGTNLYHVEKNSENKD